MRDQIKRKILPLFLSIALAAGGTAVLLSGGAKAALASETEEETVTEAAEPAEPETTDSETDEGTVTIEEPSQETEDPVEAEDPDGTEDNTVAEQSAQEEELSEEEIYEETLEDTFTEEADPEDFYEEEASVTETDSYEEDSEGEEEDPFYIGTEEAQEYPEEETEEGEEEPEEEVPQFAGESGTTDFETLPLLDLSTEELKFCAFCAGKDLGKTQTAVLFAYMKAYNGSVDAAANDGAGILPAAGLTEADYAAWCKEKEAEAEDIRNQLAYVYSAFFKGAENADTKDRFLSIFRKTDDVKTAAAALYRAVSARGISLPYSKTDITETIIPEARRYLELFRLGGEKREGTAGVAYYCQGNYANVPYDEGTVADSGCGITAFSMAASELTGLNLGPEVVASWAYANGVNTVTNWGAYWWLAQRFGIDFDGQYAGNFDLAVEALKEGKLVIVSLRQDGFFTTSPEGHYILLTGVDADGRISVNDPASYERSVYGPFEYSAIFGSCLQYWIFGR